MYFFEKLSEKGVEKICIKNNSNGEYVKIVPEFSGLINELVLNKNKKAYSILDGYDTREEFERNPYFKGAILSPFPNRLRDGKYTFLNKKYNFPINDDLFNTAIHGFYYGRKMTTTGEITNPESATLILKNNYDCEFDYYPFTFETRISYTLTHNNGIICKTELQNTGQIQMPIGIGWHPYFKIGDKVDNLLLKIPGGFYNELDPQMIPTGETFSEVKFSASEKIGEYNFNTGLKLDDQAGIVSTELYSLSENLKINFWQESGPGKYGFLQLYIPPQRTSIAIEPMSCNVDAFNNGDGLVILKPGEIFSASFGISIS